MPLSAKLRPSAIVIGVPKRVWRVSIARMGGRLANDGSTNKGAGDRTDGQSDERTDGRTNGRTDGRTDGRTGERKVGRQR